MAFFAEASSTEKARRESGFGRFGADHQAARGHRTEGKFALVVLSTVPAIIRKDLQLSEYSDQIPAGCRSFRVSTV